MSELWDHKSKKSYLYVGYKHVILFNVREQQSFENSFTAYTITYRVSGVDPRWVFNNIIVAYFFYYTASKKRNPVYSIALY